MTQDQQWLLKEKYNGEKCEAFFTDVASLQSGTPLAYLIGSMPFLDCVIFLDSHPLIPRTETEYWTEQAITKIQNFRGLTPKVLDLCAGSGAIGVAVGKAEPAAQVTFGEIDKAHLPTIKKNLAENNILDSQYKIFQSDLFENISASFDYILTNPPYIDPNADRSEMSVKNHEPHLALYGGENGMEYIEKIITQAPDHLHTHGQLWIEHEAEQTETIHHLAAKRSFAATTHKDQYGVERYSVLVLQ